MAVMPDCIALGIGIDTITGQVHNHPDPALNALYSQVLSAAAVLVSAVNIDVGQANEAPLLWSGGLRVQPQLLGAGMSPFIFSTFLIDAVLRGRSDPNQATSREARIIDALLQFDSKGRGMLPTDR